MEGARHPVSPRQDRAAVLRARRQGHRSFPQRRSRGALTDSKTATTMATRTADAATTIPSEPASAGPLAAVAEPRKATRIAAIDWMRGLVMVLMVIDHASMAYDMNHLSEDSAMYPETAVEALPPAEFLTRWFTHICAPTFVFLAGVALALSVERRVAKGATGWAIDKSIVTRGAIIALLDPTLVSL